MTTHSPLKYGLIAIVGLLISQFSSFAEILYFHDFGTATISGKPYSVAPGTLQTRLTNGGWTTSASGFINYGGSAGQALSLNNSSGSVTYTLTLTVSSGYSMTIDSLSFWRQRSSTGAQNVAITVNGQSVGIASQTVPTTGAGTGTLNATSNSANLTGTVTIVLSLSGASGAGTFRLDDFTINGSVTQLVTGNNTTITSSASSVNFNRVMVGSLNPVNNVTLSKVGSDTTTYSVGASGNATVADAGTSFAAGSQTDQISVGINRGTVGVKSGTVTVDNTIGTTGGAGQGSADANDLISVSGTVVANRVVTSSTASLGKVLVGVRTGTQTVSLTTTGLDTENTRVTVNGTQAANGGVTVAAGTSALFDAAGDTTTRNVSGTFATSGAKNVGVALSVTGEGLAGESVNGVSVTATADVYQAAALAANTASTLDDEGVATINNAATSDGGQRAEARIVTRDISDDWSVEGLDVNTVLGANGVNSSGTVGFNATGKLNGTHVGTLVIGLQHDDQSIKGTSANDLGTKTWNLSHIVSGNTGTTGSAVVGAGQSYDGFSLKNSQGKGTESGFATTDGGQTVTGETVIRMSFSETSDAGNDLDRISDVVNLSGTGDDVIVLSITYDPNDLSLGGYTSEEELKVGWLDENTNLWVVATAGNLGNNANGDQRGFVGSFADFQNIYGTDLSQYIGAYGVDVTGNSAWAVINHNSEFSVIPEPGTSLLLTVSGVGLLVFRRRRRI